MDTALEQMAREADGRLEALRRELESLPSEQRPAALARIHEAAPAVARLVNPYYGRLAAGS